MWTVIETMRSFICSFEYREKTSYQGKEKAIFDTSLFEAKSTVEDLEADVQT